MWISRWYFRRVCLFFMLESRFCCLAHYKGASIFVFESLLKLVFRLNHPRSAESQRLSINVFAIDCCHRYQYLLSTIAIIGWDLVFQITKATAKQAALEQLTIFMSSLLKHACWTGRKHGYCCNRTNPSDFVVVSSLFFFLDNVIFRLPKNV